MKLLFDQGTSVPYVLVLQIQRPVYNSSQNETHQVTN
jgi:hypothetical protein